MKTKQRAHGKRKAVKAKQVTVKGKRMVILDEAEFERLLVEADLFEPLVPGPNADGNYSLDSIRMSLALRIVRHRRKAGLTQAELARRAGIRPVLLNRIEHGHVDAGERTIEKIDKVLCDLVSE
jgi:DNA-binding XRE family transcriptional regulator